MKELKEKTTYLEQYDVTVRDYLTNAQIQQIANAVTADPDATWAERQENIDMLMLYHATDIGKEKLEELGHNALVQSGLIAKVRHSVENERDIYDAIEYAESPSRLAYKFLSQLPKLLDNDMFKAALEKYGK